MSKQFEQWIEALPPHLREHAVPIFSALMMTENPGVTHFVIATNVLSPEGWGSLLAYAVGSIISSYEAKGANASDVAERIATAFEEGLHESKGHYYPVAQGPEN